MKTETQSACDVTDEMLARFLDGETADADTVALAQHMASCDVCQVRAIGDRRWEGALAALDAERVIRWHRFASPLGPMYTARTAKGLSRVSWEQPGPAGFERSLAKRYPTVPVVRDRDALEQVEEEMTEYFDGRREGFTVPVDISDLGDFQRSVLDEACRIPFGEVIPYGELARRIDRPRAARAVGNALGANPVAIVIPCHRIVASNGKLGGYTGGVACKRRLLGVEGRRDLFDREA